MTEKTESRTCYMAFCSSGGRSEPSFWFEDTIVVLNTATFTKSFFDSLDELVNALNLPQNDRLLERPWRIYKVNVKKGCYTEEPILVLGNSFKSL